MKNILIFLLLCGIVQAQSYEKCKAYLIQEEGKYNISYFDSMGNRTIGIGHKILPNERLLSVDEEKIDELFRMDLLKAVDAARASVPNYDQHSEDVKIAIVSMTFNLGHAGFFKFKEFRKALIRKDYSRAIKEIDNSKWATQVPNRAKRVIKVLTNAHLGAK